MRASVLTATPPPSRPVPSTRATLQWNARTNATPLPLSLRRCVSRLTPARHPHAHCRRHHRVQPRATTAPLIPFALAVDSRAVGVAPPARVCLLHALVLVALGATRLVPLVALTAPCPPRSCDPQLERQQRSAATRLGEKLPRAPRLACSWLVVPGSSHSFAGVCRHATAPVCTRFVSRVNSASALPPLAPPAPQLERQQRTATTRLGEPRPRVLCRVPVRSCC